MTSVDDEVAQLSDGITDLLLAGATVRVQETADSAAEFLLWVRHYEIAATDGTALSLLRGAKAAVIEAAAMCAAGFGRASLGAIRQQIDLMTSYVYFKDHPREWARVTETGDGFMLPSEVRKYHQALQPRLGARLDYLEKRGLDTVNGTYRLLSAHVHGQSELTAPKTGHLREALLSRPLLDEIPQFQLRASLALSNYFVALRAEEWFDLPEEPVRRVSMALTDDQRVQFFS